MRDAEMPVGKWVSVYFNDTEYSKFLKVLERERKRRGDKKLSRYKLVREWVMERLRKECGEDQGQADESHGSNT